MNSSCDNAPDTLKGKPDKIVFFGKVLERKYFKLLFHEDNQHVRQHKTNNQNKKGKL